MGRARKSHRLTEADYEDIRKEVEFLHEYRKMLKTKREEYQRLFRNRPTIKAIAIKYGISREWLYNIVKRG